MPGASFYVLDCFLDLSGFLVVVHNYDFQRLESGEEFVNFFFSVVVMG